MIISDFRRGRLVRLDLRFQVSSLPMSSFEERRGDWLLSFDWIVNGTNGSEQNVKAPGFLQKPE